MTNLKIIKHFIVSLAILVAVSGCASRGDNYDPVISGLLLTEPEPVSARSQLAIAQYTNYLYRAQMTDVERADILLKRGFYYDAIGLASLARMDYAEAIKLNPLLAEAHNSVGVHYIQAGMFMRAYESFDSSLEINPEYDYALLNRGIALYYGGRSELAQSDTLAFLQNDESDPFRVLWHFIIGQGVDQIAALQTLSEHREKLPNNNWATSIVDFYLARKTESEVIADLLTDVSSQTQLNNRLCEAYFYLGKHFASAGNVSRAENYFKLSLSTNVYDYAEHKYARIELTNLRQERRSRAQ